MINWSKYSYKVENKKTSRRKHRYPFPSYNVEDTFRHFRQVNSTKKALCEIKQPLFKQIISEYNKVLGDYMLKGFVVKIPFGLGELGIRKRKVSYDPEQRKYLPTNKLFLEKGKPFVYHLSEASNGWTARYFWNKKKCRIENQSYYSFKATNILKKKLSKVMLSKGGYLNYYEIKPKKK
jgi:hypothetical protein